MILASSRDLIFTDRSPPPRAGAEVKLLMKKLELDKRWLLLKVCPGTDILHRNPPDARFEKLFGYPPISIRQYLRIVLSEI